jgi:ubiquitin-protein ligase
MNMANTARILRLKSDQKALMNIGRKSEFITVESISGNPPYKYLVTYNVPGYVDQSGSTRDVHQVDLSLPEGYPISEPPRFHFRRELWHPNVFSNGDVCLGFSASTWSFGYDIDQLIYDVGNMIRFSPESCNLDSLAQNTINKSGWESWIRRHRTPLVDIDFNVGDVPVVKITKPREVDVKIKGKKKKAIQIKIRDLGSKDD